MATQLKSTDGKWSAQVLMEDVPMTVYDVQTIDNHTSATIVCVPGKTFQVVFSVSKYELTKDFRCMLSIDGNVMQRHVKKSASIVEGYRSYFRGRRMTATTRSPYLFTYPVYSEEAINRDTGAIVLTASTGSISGTTTWRKGKSSLSAGVSESKGEGKASAMTKLGKEIDTGVTLISPLWSQTAYEEANPLWTFSFTYHTQEMFDAMHQQTIMDDKHAAMARNHGQDNPIEILESEDEVLSVNESDDDDDNDDDVEKKPIIKKTIKLEVDVQTKAAAAGPSNKKKRKAVRSPSPIPEVKQEEEPTAEQLRAAQDDLTKRSKKANKKYGNAVDLCDSP